MSILLNGDFETWPTPASPPTSWTNARTAGLIVRDTDVHGGSFAAQIQANSGGNTGGLDQAPTWLANTTYTLTYWAKTILQHVTDQFRVIVFDTGTFANIFSDQRIVPTVYTFYSFNFTTGPSTALQLDFSINGASMTVNVDDVTLDVLAAPRSGIHVVRAPRGAGA